MCDEGKDRFFFWGGADNFFSWKGGSRPNKFEKHWLGPTQKLLQWNSQVWRNFMRLVYRQKSRLWTMRAGGG